MLKISKFLVLLTTISCGYTSNLKNQSNLNNITNNYSTINNNVDNSIFSNEVNNNNDTLNTNKYLGKKMAREVIEEENNAYKYLFTDKHNEYFSFDNTHVEPSNPEYKQLMENLYDMFNDCLDELFNRMYHDEKEDTELLNTLNEITVDKELIKEIATEFDSFKFSDKENYVLANNNLSNLDKYIENNKSIDEKGVSFCDFYICYVYNHISKLYYQTAIAVKKSIDNNEQISKQSEIINEFGRVLDGVLDIISVRIEEKQLLHFNNELNMEKYNDVLDDMYTRMDICRSPILHNKIREFNYDNEKFLKQFNYIHNDVIKYDLNELIGNIDNYKPIKIDTKHSEQLKSENEELFNNLLNGLNIGNQSFVKTCKNFLINGRYDISIKQYLMKLLINIDILKYITVQKIKYQIEHEHIITIENSVLCYKFIIKNIFENIKEQYQENKELYDTLFNMLCYMNNELCELCYCDESYKDEDD